MKFSISSEEFVGRLSVVTRAISSRTAVQTLSGVLIAAEADRLVLSATDMELSLEASAPLTAADPGRAIAPGRLLLDVARSLPSGKVDVTLDAAEQVLELAAGSSSFKLRTLPLDDFPKLPSAEGGLKVELPTELFVETSNRVARAASRDETRPHLTGVLVSAEAAELRMVATDSYRLSVKETNLDAAISEKLEVNVPARTLQELARVAGSGAEGKLAITALQNQVVFELDGITLSSRLVEGRFPNYRQLLPESYDHELKIDRAELLEVVRRISLLAQKNTPLRLSLEDGALEVSAVTADVGEARESLPVPFKGEPLAIGFNADFFREGLDTAESEEVVLKLISPLRPGLIQSGDDAGFQYLVMPIRLNV